MIPGFLHASRLIPPAAGLLLVLWFAAGANGMSKQSITYDEPAHLRYGYQVAAGDTSRFDDSKMPVTALNTLPTFFKTLFSPRSTWDREETVYWNRIPTLVAGALLGCLVFAWAARIGGAGAGLAALALFVLDPNLAAHSRLITTDVYGSLGIALAVCAFWSFVERPGPVRAILAGAALGAALLCKFTSVYLAVLFPALAAIRWAAARDDAGRSRRLLTAFAWTPAVAAVSLAVLAAGYLGNGWGTPLIDYDFKSDLFIGLIDQAGPLAYVPLPFPKPFIEGLDWVKFYELESIGRGPGYLFGEVSRSPFAGYYAWVLAYKVPLAVHILIVWMTAGWFAAVRRGAAAKDLLCPIVTAVFFMGYFTLFCNAQMGVRMILPVFPPLYVFAGVLIARRLADAFRETRPERRAWVPAALLSLAVWGAVSVGRHYPHLIGYFNELAGPPTRYYRILADSNLEWGQNVNYVRDYAHRQAPIQVNPLEPKPGRIVISANYLIGIVKPTEYAWARWLTRHKEPVDHIGFGYLVYDLTEADITSIRSGLAG